MNFSSQLLEGAVNAFASLPGIGKKTALRLALHLLESEEDQVADFCQALVNMKEGIQFCSKCNNISDSDICSICSNLKRDASTICVVESIKEIMAIENTDQYFGSYHVLGGVISPVDGIGPKDLNIDGLMERIEEGTVKEIIMAISPSVEGETTIFYISKLLKDKAVKISTIARGVSFGGELEYADEITLGRSILSRISYEK